MSDKKKLLFEDLSMPGGSYNQTNNSPSGSTQFPRKVNLVDLLDYQKRADDATTRAPNVLPFPLTKNVVEQIGDIYVQSAKVQSEFSQAYQSPLISDDENATKAVKSIFKKLEKIKLIVKSVTNDLKELDIE